MSELTVLNLKVGMLQENVYIVHRKGCKQAILVDPGDEIERIDALIAENGLQIDAVLVTHCHFDHIGAVADYQARGARVYMHAVDPKAMHATVLHGKVLGQRIRKFSADIELCDGQEFEEAGMRFRAIATPGHSASSLCYLAEDCLFTGDTIFRGTYGRTDFADGSQADIYASIVHKIFVLPGDYRIFPGHEEFSTLEYERVHNDILKIRP